MVTNLNKRLRTVLLVAVLLLVAMTLTSCGVPKGDINLDAPPGWFEAIFVYPLAKFLIILTKAIAGIGIPYSYGWAIIVLTVLVKVVTLPLTMKQLQSSKTMMALQPKQRELQEKYGKDKQKLAEEQMKLYKDAGANPMGGCLPLFIQMPVLIALYQSLYVLANPSVRESVIELQGAGFYWIKDLAFPDLQTGISWIQTSFVNQDWGTLIAYLILPIITLISSFVQQKMAQQPKDPKATKDAQAQMMNQMMVFMPLMFGWFSLTVPSGLVLYWVISTILSIVPQYFVTGWGGLVDWFPALKGRGPGVPMAPSGQVRAMSAPPAKPAAATSIPATTGGVPATTGGVPATTDQPTRPIIKRRSKRHK